jgi:transketolase
MLDIAARRRLSHLGSCCSCLPILCEIYAAHATDVVVLSNGHAGLALYCVLEHVFGHDAEALLERHGIHPCYDPQHGIYCSTGSLGCGLAVAIGYALAGLRTHVVVSDGECAEGIVWECLAFVSEHPELPITIHVNANGFAATRPVDRNTLSRRLYNFCPKLHFHWTTNAPFEGTVAAHYSTLTSEEAEHAAGLC